MVDRDRELQADLEWFLNAMGISECTCRYRLDEGEWTVVMWDVHCPCHGKDWE